jgi:hydroxymethylglutaryl-CoA synthase
MTAITGLGTYVPRYALSAEAVTEAWGQFHGAGIERTAVPAADEDALTMAHEAATNALDAAGADPADIEGLLVATTTPPTEEEPVTARLVSTLALDSGARTRQLTGSTRAGVGALIAAADADGPTLVVASDAPRGAPDSDVEHAAGAAAAAAVVDADGPASITDTGEHTEAVPGNRFRPAGAGETTGLGITSYDRDAYTSAVAAATDALAFDPADAAALALQAPNGKLPYRAAGALGIETEQIAAGTVVSETGDCGTAGPLLGLAAAERDGHAPALVVGYGSGSASAAVVEGEVPVESGPGAAIVPPESEREALSYGEYLRLRGEITSGEPDGGGAYVSVPSWKRTMAQRHRLVAGRCTDCGALAFPPAGACTDCGTFESYEAVRLPGTGTVEAATTIGAGGAPPEFVEQQAKSGSYTSAVVALDGPDGGSVSIPTQVVGTDDAVSVGDRVEATIRRIYTQEAVTRYGFKTRPLDSN